MSVQYLERVYFVSSQPFVMYVPPQVHGFNYRHHPYRSVLYFGMLEHPKLYFVAYIFIIYTLYTLFKFIIFYIKTHCQNLRKVLSFTSFYRKKIGFLAYLKK